MFFTGINFGKKNSEKLISAGAGFKRFNNDDNANFDENNYTSIDTSPGMNFNPNNNRGQAPGTMRNHNINKPESAVFQTEKILMHFKLIVFVFHVIY